MIVLDLPLPPSVNAAFAGGRAQRHLTMKTAAYRFWLQQVQERYGDHRIGAIGAVPYGLWIELPMKMRGDIDNRVKLLSDVLRRTKDAGFGLAVVEDDDAMSALYVQREPGLPKDECRVAVVRMPDWRDFVSLKLEI